jgi:hypothetical protein
MGSIMLSAKQRLRDMRDYKGAVTSSQHVALSPEVQHTLDLWKERQQCVLIGGLALSFYAKPRYTEDVDLLFLHEADLPKEVVGFKRVRPHSFEERSTHAEVEALTPTYLGIAQALAQKVFDTSVKHDGWRVASREGLIALKLQRASRRDQGDIESIVEADTDMNGWHLTEKQLELFHTIKAERFPKK